MNLLKRKIDVLENTLRRKGALLDLLLFDHTTKKNIIWATDSYEKFGKEFNANMIISPDLVTGKYGLLIQPRAAKSLSEQKHRTKNKAEVFTPLRVVGKINKMIDNLNKDSLISNNWKKYVRELKLEISCGEAPFIVNRYNPVAYSDRLNEIGDRVGFLDKKLKVVSQYCDSKKKWLFWAKEAFKSSYGYEWQGDNVLLARENLLYTFIDYYKAKFKETPSLKNQEIFAEIINWNIFQMDGLKYVVPMSCYCEESLVIGKTTLFGKNPDKIEKHNCEGCTLGKIDKHNGKYVKIMDWKKNKIIKFIDLLTVKK